MENKTATENIKWYKSKFWPVIFISVGCIVFLILIKMFLNIVNP